MENPPDPPVGQDLPSAWMLPEFVEFLEAVVRVADKTEIPHCVIDEFTWGVDEIAPEMRETYGNRETVTKLEAFIMLPGMQQITANSIRHNDKVYHCIARGAINNSKFGPAQ